MILSLLSGSTRASLLEAGERDRYTVSLTAGESYTFQLRGADSFGGTLLDPRLVVRFSDGTLAGRDDDGGLGRDAFLRFTAKVSGTYTLDVLASDGGVGSYSLSGRTGSRDLDGNGGTWTTSTLTMDGDRGSLDGTIKDKADHDFHRLILEGGDTLVFRLDAPNDEGVILNPKLKVHDADGVVLAEDWDSGPGLNARIRFTAPEDGAYYLNAGGQGANVGPYVLLARELDNDLLN